MFSDVFVPDFQQAQEYHKELLKKAEQERVALQAMKAHNYKPASSRGLGLLRQLLAGRHPKNFAETASRSSNDQT
ncbi:MAG: hypothetical protein HZB19_11680 [Chloroflexi bacterium]|nr:hypothetical protein [Chloroflexota bacterium]